MTRSLCNDDDGSSPALPRDLFRRGEDLSRSLYLNPLSSLADTGATDVPYEVMLRAGSDVSCTHASLKVLRGWAREEGAAAHVEQLLARIGASPASFAGLSLERPRIMGIINVTPDSFSDGGEAFDAAAAIARGHALMEAGADLLDIGGESTRPGAEPVPVDEECARVEPVVRAMSEAGYVVSVDTRRCKVMRSAIEAGAKIINDVTALAGDPDSMKVVSEAGVAVVLMHMRGEPRTMQENPQYDNAVLDVCDFLGGRVAACEAQGITRERIAVDPGIGFGKTVGHNLEILARLGVLKGLGCAVLVGVSRKSFIARISAGEPPKERLAGSLAAALASVALGARILRVHDVAATRQALAVMSAIEQERG